MLEKVQSVIADLRPIIQAYGGDAELVSVNDGLVQIKLTGGIADSTYPIPIRDFIQRELQAEVEGVNQVEFIDLGSSSGGVSVTFEEPGAEDHTVVFTLDSKLNDSTEVFKTPEEAAGNPLAEALFDVGFVEFVLFKKEKLILARNGGEWAEIIANAQDVIQAHYRGESTSGPRGETTDHDENIRTQVNELLETEINPAVASHGGYIELNKVDHGVVYLTMGGGCQGCSSSAATLRQGVETAIRDGIPHVVAVKDMTDHDSGENPYYSSV
jgi:Fe-S cluster biogenesis protein NfuA